MLRNVEISTFSAIGGGTAERRKWALSSILRPSFERKEASRLNGGELRG